MVRFCWYSVEGVDGKRSLDVAGRIEVYEIVGTCSGDGVDEDVGKVSVGVEDCNSGVGVDVSRCKAL